MNITEIRKNIESGALTAYSEIYSNLETAGERILCALSAFSEKYGEEREAFVLSVPGRSEISGNHTDHNNGLVLAGAIDRDVIAVVSKREDGIIRLYSEGYSEIKLRISDLGRDGAFEKFTSRALIFGVADGFIKEGYEVGGYDAYLTSEVLAGSGISSSAAFEVMLGNIFSHLYNGGKVSPVMLAKIAKYAENVYFGKPSGLMDQLAVAVGGFVYIDFENESEPHVEPIDFSLSDNGYLLAIINTGGSHADLNDDYASVPAEMRSVARIFGKEALRGLTEEDILKNIQNIREELGDRAILRAIHFIRENERVLAMKRALEENKIEDFLSGIRDSGNSSFKYLQNVYTNKNVKEQGLSLALALADGFLLDGGACRVHGGGFAGTVQAFVPKTRGEEFRRYMDSAFGEGSTMMLNIRPLGATRLF